jgi:hypothetical protein
VVTRHYEAEVAVWLLNIQVRTMEPLVGTILWSSVASVVPQCAVAVTTDDAHRSATHTQIVGPVDPVGFLDRGVVLESHELFDLTGGGEQLNARRRRRCPRASVLRRARSDRLLSRHPDCAVSLALRSQV